MDVIAENFTFILFGLVVMWILQFGLAYFQIRRFYGRMIELKRHGLTAVGLEGGRYRGRSYAVLTVDEHNRVIHAEQFSGWTVFARLKPVPEMAGMHLDEVLAKQSHLPVPTKLQAAFVSAAKDLQAARQKQAEPILNPI